MGLEDDSLDLGPRSHERRVPEGPVDLLTEWALIGPMSSTGAHVAEPGSLGSEHADDRLSVGGVWDLGAEVDHPSDRMRSVEASVVEKEHHESIALVFHELDSLPKLSFIHVVHVDVLVHGGNSNSGRPPSHDHCPKTRAACNATPGPSPITTAYARIIWTTPLTVSPHNFMAKGRLRICLFTCCGVFLVVVGFPRPLQTFIKNSY
jgi:hypothetical protein